MVTREHLFQFLELGLGRIVWREVEHLLYMLNEWIERTVLVVGGTAELNADRTVVGDMVSEFLGEPGLADAGFATEQDDLAFAV
jgi:hypothetical protein